MRLLAWFLVLLNVGLMAYFNLDVLQPKAVVVDQSIQPDKMKILSEKELDALPKKDVAATADVATSVPPVPVETSCFKWGNFTQTNLPAAQVVLARLSLQSMMSQEATAQEDKRFWVYYPPLKTATLAQQKAAEIKALGVQDLYILQDSQWRNAISFGLFQDEQLATKLLNELQEKGIKGATKSLRSQGKVLTSLLLKDVNTLNETELLNITPEFLGAELHKVDCP